MKKSINKEENKHLKLNVGAILIARNYNENTSINTKTNVRTRLVSNKAITLISLVITIILLILLAGVAINLSLGENGIFNKVKQTKEQYTESIAKEKLEMVLLDVIAEKGTNSEYNNGQFLDDMLKANGIEVQGDNVIIDNYIFTIDRDGLGITQSLGQTQIKVTKEVQSYLGKNANDKYEAQLLVIIESNINLQKVEIITPDGIHFQIETDKEKIAKDITVEFDQEYKLEITDKAGKKETRTIVERTEEGIRTAEELVEFRDKVNTGLTYEGKVINLLKGIDLSTVCGEDVNGEEISWFSIGYFKGIFDGNYHTIDNLYINSDKMRNALFTMNEGTIKNLILNDIYITARCSETCYYAGITSVNFGKIENCAVNGVIDVYTTQRMAYAGGITAENIGIINNCYNKTRIKAIAVSDQARIGGITGESKSGATVTNCYNSGIIEGSSNSSEIEVGGICGMIYTNNPKVSNCYNIGNISGTSKRGTYVGGIVGLNGSSSSYPRGTITNSYYEENTSQCSYYELKVAKYEGKITEEALKHNAEILGDEYIDDINNINNGYPILKWQIEKE